MGRHLRQEIRTAQTGERAVEMVTEMVRAGAVDVRCERLAGYFTLTAYYPEVR